MAKRISEWVADTDKTRTFRTKGEAETFDNQSRLCGFISDASGNPEVAKAVMTHVTKDPAGFAAVAKPFFPKVSRPRKAKPAKTGK